MTTNNSQIGSTPAAPLLVNNENQPSIDQLLSVEIVTTSQPIIQFTTINMIPSQISLIPNVSEHGNVIERRERRRRRRQRQRQRRRNALRQLQEEQQARQLIQQRRRQSANQRRLERQQQYNQRREYGQQRQRLYDPWGRSGVFEQAMNRTHNQLVVAQSPCIREPNSWEQNQMDELEESAASEQLALIQDEIEQENQINLVEKVIEEEREQRNHEELIQLEQWESDAFIVQQLNHK